MYPNDFMRFLREMAQLESMSRIHNRQLRYRMHYMQRIMNRIQAQRFKLIRTQHTKHK